MATPAPEPAASPIGSGRRWTLVALLVFACATASLLHGCWGRSPAEVAPVGIPGRLGLAEDDYTHRILSFDHRFTVWLVARNAYTLLNRPHSLFDAEPCHPAENALALGEPAIALSLLGTPAWLLTGDPVTTYNAVMLAFLLIAPFAMFLLVRDWTGSAAAGIVAGLRQIARLRAPAPHLRQPRFPRLKRCERQRQQRPRSTLNTAQTATPPPQPGGGAVKSWSARQGSNRRPSAWEENPNPRKPHHLRSRDRRGAASNGTSRHRTRQAAPRRHRPEANRRTPAPRWVRDS